MINTRGKSFAGWVLIAVVVLQIIVNFGIVMVFNVQNLWKQIRIYRMKKQRAKELKRRTEAQKIRNAAVKKYEDENKNEKPEA